MTLNALQCFQHQLSSNHHHLEFFCLEHEFVNHFGNQRFTDVMTDEDINIEHMTNASRGDYAYTMFDLSKTPSAEALEKLKSIEGVLRVRVI